MSKEEFIELIGDDKNLICGLNEQWETIQRVYNYHPSICNIDGKNQIALLYKTFGMRIIKDMVNTAHEAEIFEDEIRHATKILEEIKTKYNQLKS